MRRCSLDQFALRLGQSQSKREPLAYIPNASFRVTSPPILGDGCVVSRPTVRSSTHHSTSKVFLGSMFHSMAIRVNVKITSFPLQPSIVCFRMVVFSIYVSPVPRKRLRHGGASVPGGSSTNLEQLQHVQYRMGGECNANVRHRMGLEQG